MPPDFTTHNSATLPTVNTPTPLQEISDAETKAAGVQILVKREDLIHPQISGNKWRKLKYNLIEAKNNGYHTLLTFGGAYSNHIYAVAAAGKLTGLQTIGIIRGEEVLSLNSTLSFARQCGMHLHFIDRTTYREKANPDFTKSLHDLFGDFYLVPEGGSNGLAVKGCAEIIEEIKVPFNYICCSCGTGGTLAGLIAGAEGKGQLIGFSALKGGEFLSGEVKNLLQAYTLLVPEPFRPENNWRIETRYHFGGYAKVNPVLSSFIESFKARHAIPLDPVYTSKMLYGIYDLIKNGFFKRGDSIIAIHTGGLQGRGS